MSIPKIIHYCWFGRKTMPSNLVKYRETWKKYLSDYEIMEWNEDNFDISSCEYVKVAYEAKKYAFVSDYVRLYALKEYGGIYFDVDIQVLRRFDELLVHQGIFGFESDEKVMSAFLAVSKGNAIIEELLELYQYKKFSMDKEEPNTVLLTKLLKQHGLVVNNKTQILSKDIVIFSNEYFNAYDFSKAHSLITENTYTVHHCLGSWCSFSERMWFRMKHLTNYILGNKNYERIKTLKKQIIGR